MTLDQLQIIGRKQLPVVNNYPLPVIRISITKDLNWDLLDVYRQEEYPGLLIAPVYILEYRKGIHEGKFTVWEFVGLVNGC